MDPIDYATSDPFYQKKRVREGLGNFEAEEVDRDNEDDDNDDKVYLTSSFRRVQD